MARSWPLTGRDPELHRVGSAIRPGSTGIVVAGPAGVGKTRLAREAAAVAARRGVTVEWAHGSVAASSIPLGAFAGILDLPVGDAAGAIAHVLEDLQRRQPMVLVVDDAHLLDEHSAIVLHRLVQRGSGPVLVTLRTGERTHDPVTALWKDEHLPRLDLVPLDDATTTGLVAQVLGGPVESASAHRLWALTEGSPLFLRHLLSGEVAAGRFAVTAGIWRWTSEPELSPELTALLEQQTGDLPAGVQEVVDLVTLAEPLALATLTALTAAADVEQAEDRGLVRVDGSLVRLAHPLYGEVRRSANGGRCAPAGSGGWWPARSTSGPTPSPRPSLTLESDLPTGPGALPRCGRGGHRPV